MKINKYISAVFFASLMAVGFAACSDKDDDKKAENNSNNNQGTAARVVVLSEVEMTYEEIADEVFGQDVLGQNSGGDLDDYSQMMAEMRADFETDVQNAVDNEGGTNGNGDKDAFTVTVMTIEYPSIGADGKPIQLSGTLSIPKINDESIVKNLLVSCHPTSMNDQMMSQTNFKNLAADGLAILEPHYEGFGASRNKPQCYLCQKTIGRQCADMIPAAIRVMREQGIVLPADHWTSIIGYSQGGGNAMATARYLQEYAPDSLRNMANVRKLCCGAGPYDPMATFEHWLQTDSVSMSMVLPMVINGMMQGHADVMQGIRLTQYFSDVYLSCGVVQGIESGNPGGMAAMSCDASDELESIRLGQVGVMQYWMRFSGIMSDEVANPDSHIRKALETCLRAEIVNDWTPRHPVEIYSSRKDNVIPYQANALATYNKFQTAGVDVTIVNTSTMDHLFSQVNWQYRINKNKSYK